MSFRTINVRVTADVSGYQSQLQSAIKSTKNFQKQAQAQTQNVNPGVNSGASVASIQQSIQALQKQQQAQQRLASTTTASGKASVSQHSLLKEVLKENIYGVKMFEVGVLRAAQASTMLGKAWKFTTAVIATAGVATAGWMMLHAAANRAGQAVSFMTDAFMNFDAQMVESMAIMDEADRKMRGVLEAAVFDVSKSVAFAPKDLAEGLYFLASAGFTATQSIEMLPVAAKFAQAGLMSLEKGTEMLVDLQQAFNQPPDFSKKDPFEDTLFDPNNLERTKEGAERVADVITQAAIDSNATIEQVGSALMNKLAAQARLIGMPIEEATAMVETLASQGVKGQVAGTAAMMALRDLQRTAIKKAGTYKQYGIQIFDEKGEILRIDNILQQFETKMMPLSDKARRQMLMDLGFQDRSVAAILSMIGRSEQMTRFIVRNNTVAQGAAERVSKNQMDSLKKQFAMVRNFFARLSIGIGKAMLAAWTKLSETLGPMFKQLVKGGKELWETLKPILSILGKVAGGALIATLSTLAAVIEKVAYFAEKFPGAFVPVLAMFGISKIKQIQKVKDALQGLSEGMAKNNGFAGFTKNRFGSFLAGEGGRFSKAAAQIRGTWNGLLGLGKKPLSFTTVYNMPNLKKAAAHFGPGAQKIFEKMYPEDKFSASYRMAYLRVDEFKKRLKAGFPVISERFANLGATVKAFGTAFQTTFGPLASQVGKFVMFPIRGLGKLGSAFGEFANSVASGVSSTTKNFTKLHREAGSSMKNTAKALLLPNEIFTQGKRYKEYVVKQLAFKDVFKTRLIPDNLFKHLNTGNIDNFKKSLDSLTLSQLLYFKNAKVGRVAQIFESGIRSARNLHEQTAATFSNIRENVAVTGKRMAAMYQLAGRSARTAAKFMVMPESFFKKGRLPLAKQLAQQFTFTDAMKMRMLPPNVFDFYNSKKAGQLKKDLSEMKLGSLIADQFRMVKISPNVIGRIYRQLDGIKNYTINTFKGIGTGGAFDPLVSLNERFKNITEKMAIRANALKSRFATLFTPGSLTAQLPSLSTDKFVSSFNPARLREQFASVFAGLKSSATSAFNYTAGLSSDVFKSFKENSATAWSNFKTSTMNITGALKNNLPLVFDIVRTKSKTMFSSMVENARSLGGAIKTLPSQIRQSMSSRKADFWASAKKSWGTFRTSLISDWKAVGKAAKAALSFNPTNVATARADGLKVRESSRLAIAKEQAMMQVTNQMQMQADQARMLASQRRLADVNKLSAAEINVLDKMIEQNAALGAQQRQMAANIQAAKTRGQVNAATGGQLGGGIMGKFSGFGGQLMMASMFVLPAIQDFENKMNDARARIQDSLKKLLDIEDISELMDYGTWTQLSKSLSNNFSELEKVMEDDTWAGSVANVDQGINQIWGGIAIAAESLLGPIIGTEFKENWSEAKARIEAAEELEKKRSRLQKLFQSGTKHGLLEFYSNDGKNKKPKGPLYGKNAIEQMDAVEKKAKEMKINLMDGENDIDDFIKVLDAMQQDLTRQEFLLPGVDLSALEGTTEEIEEQKSEILDKFKELRDGIADIYKDLFSTEALIDNVSETKDLIYTSLTDVTSIVSDFKSEANDAISEQAENKADAFNDNIDNQVDAIDDKIKEIRKKLAKDKKKSRTDRRKERLDEEADARIEALEEQKDSLRDGKKSSEDFIDKNAPEPVMSLDKFISDTGKANEKTRLFQFYMQNLKNKLTDSALAGEIDKNSITPILESFSKLGEDAIPMLKEFTESTPEQVKQWVVKFNQELGNIGDVPVPTVDELLTEMNLSGKNEFTQNLVRLSGITGKGPEEVLPLMISLKDKAPEFLQNFVREWDAASESERPGLVAKFNELVDAAINADAIDGDKFVAGVAAMMQGAADEVNGKGSTLMLPVIDSLTEAEVTALRVQAVLEAMAGGTQWQKAYIAAAQAYNTRTNTQTFGLTPYGINMPGNVGQQTYGANGKPVYGPAPPGTVYGTSAPEKTSRGTPVPYALPSEAEMQVVIQTLMKYDNLPQTQGSKFRAIEDYLKRVYPATYDAYTNAIKPVGSRTRAITAKDAQNILQYIPKAVKAVTQKEGKLYPITPYADGGIVNKPTYGVFGEAGPEVILPLSKPKRMIELLTTALQQTGQMPEFADGAIFAKDWANNRAASVSNTQRPASYDMVGAPLRGPSGGNIVVVPVPIETRNETNFNGPVIGYDLETVQKDAERKKRMANLT